MKRILALFLSLVTLFSLFSCGQAEAEPPASLETKTEEQKKPAKPKETKDDFEYPEICDTLTPEALAAIPVAKEGMTESELRQICLDYFHLQLTFAWTPSKSIKYTVESSGSVVNLSRGTVYGGLPYVTDSLGNLYRVLDFYDPETGVITPTAKDQDFAEIFGNQCSYGAYWAWSRVCNTLSYRYTNTITAKHGAIPVGPYKYDTKKIESFSASGGTTKICRDNGEQIMFQSYAALKPADGLVYYTTAGHVVMCASEPVVSYKTDGTIDGSKSYIKIMDQNGGWEAATQSDGSYYEVQGGIYTKKTFDKLFSSKYIPFTIAEFQGTDPVEDGRATLDPEDGKTDLTGLKEAELEANYPISHIHVKVLDENGKEAYRYVSRTREVNTYEVDMAKCVFPMTLKKYADGKHTLEIVCFLGNGEQFTVFSGTVKE